MHASEKTTKLWMGHATILPGIGIFKGESGDNVEHRHWANQISIALDNTLTLSSIGEVHQGKAFFIASNTPHKLSKGRVLSIYLDPFIKLHQDVKILLNNKKAINDISELAPRILTMFGGPKKIAQGVDRFRTEFLSPKKDLSPDRLNTVLNALHQSVYANEIIKRAQLAQLIELSETRFSHWFKEQTGMPLRSYRKWLRVIHTMEKVLDGDSVTDAAYAANFSDQAYFANTFKKAFGVTPAVALNNVRKTTT